MIAAQGGRPGALERLQPHPQRAVLRAARAGFVVAVDAVALGEAARELVARSGSGAGIVAVARIGDAGAPGGLLLDRFSLRRRRRRRNRNKRCAALDAGDQIERPLFDLVVNAPQIFARDSDRNQLHPAEK